MSMRDVREFVDEVMRVCFIGGVLFCAGYFIYQWLK